MAFGKRSRDAEEIADTPAMDRYFTSLDHLDDGQLLALTAAWQAIDRETHEDAWTAVRATSRRGRVAQAVREVRDRAMDWAMRADNRPPLYHVFDDGLAHAQIRHGAAPAVVDTALGIALARRLDPGSRATLLAPWESAIGSLELLGFRSEDLG